MSSRLEVQRLLLGSSGPMDQLRPFNVEQAIQHALTLPTGFTQRAPPPPVPNYDAQTVQLNKNIEKAIQRWERTCKRDALVEALEYSLKIISANANSNPLVCGRELYRAGICAQLLGNLPESCRYLRQALIYHKKSGDIQGLFRSIGVLYSNLESIVTTLRGESKSQKAAGFQHQLWQVRKEHSELQNNFNAEPVFQNAHRVEQGRIGFSNREYIGTDNINECICVIIWDPISKKTALGHLDDIASTASLRKLSDGLISSGVKPSDLAARIVGARFNPFDSLLHRGSAFPEQFKQAQATSKTNVSRVLEFLYQQDIKLLSADIFNLEQPACVIVDPSTFSLFEAAPGLNNPNRHLECEEGIMASDYQRPLTVSFDLTISSNRNPVYLSRRVVQKLREYLVGKPIWRIYEGFKGAQIWAPKRPQLVEGAISLVRSYEAALTPVLDAIHQAAAAAERSGVIIKRDDMSVAMQHVKELGLYVGCGAAKANKPLIDFILDQLFTVHAGSYSFNLERLRNFELEK